MGRVMTAAWVASLLWLGACEQRTHDPATPAPESVKEQVNSAPAPREDREAAQTPVAPEARRAPEEPSTPPPPPAAATEAQPQAKEGDVVNRTETDSGLIIEDLVIGTGAEAQPFATVKIHYRGTLPDGKEFDSSYSRNEPATFSLRQLIKGWQEGIPGMKVGGKRRLIVPPELGYGSRGVPGVIPPNSTLVFEIELLDLPPR